MALIRAVALLYIIHALTGHLVLAIGVEWKRQIDETGLENVSHAFDTATATETSTISTTLTITQSPTRTTLGYYSGSEYTKDGITTTVCKQRYHARNMQTHESTLTQLNF